MQYLVFVMCIVLSACLGEGKKEQQALSVTASGGRTLVVRYDAARTGLLFDYQGVWLNSTWTPSLATQEVEARESLEAAYISLAWHCLKSNSSKYHPHRFNVYVNGDLEPIIIDTSVSQCGQLTKYLIFEKGSSRATSFSVLKISEPNWAGFDAEDQNFVEFVSFSFDTIITVRPGSTITSEGEKRSVSVTFENRQSGPVDDGWRRIEFLGDSITAGYCNLCHEDPSLPSGYEQESFAASWAHLTCNAFGASCHTEAWSGRGLIRNCCDNNGTLMPDIYRRTLATVTTEKPLRIGNASVSNAWDFSSSSFPAPDVIVINLGSNDYSGPNIDPAFKASFLAGYKKLLHFIKGVYSSKSTSVFLACGPVVELEGYCEVVLELIAEADIPNLYFLDHRHVLTNATKCCNHPDAVAHERMAAIAVARIGSVMGWL